jgi:hypothetical protein
MAGLLTLYHLSAYTAVHPTTQDPEDPSHPVPTQHPSPPTMDCTNLALPNPGGLPALKHHTHRHLACHTKPPPTFAHVPHNLEPGAPQRPAIPCLTAAAGIRCSTRRAIPLCRHCARPEASCQTASTLMQSQVPPSHHLPLEGAKVVSGVLRELSVCLRKWNYQLEREID